jgi:glycosyltransferase involved in cell wall biosynthesis
MIAHLLEGRYQRIRLFHVRMAFSAGMESVGRFRPMKLWVLLRTVLAVWWARFRYCTPVLYYPPAGPNRVPVLRDLVLLGATRWLFRRTVFHFHASGVSGFRKELPAALRPLFDLAYHRPDLAIRTAPQNPDDGAALRAHRSVVVPNGIPDLRGQVPERIAAPGDPLTVLYTGVLTPTKGVRILLEAFHAVVSEGVNARLELMGQWDGPAFEQACRSMVAEHGLSGRVEFLGVKRGLEKWSVFAACDVFCFPSFFEAESFGLVAVEAMQFAKPVVATTWRGIPSVVQHGVNGFLVPPREAQPLAEHLLILLRDAHLRRRMGEEGRRIFTERFTLEAFQRAMENELASLQTV